MRLLRYSAVTLAALLTIAVLTPAARAQVRSGPFVRSSAFGPRMRPVFVRVPTVTYINVQTSASVPDGGSVVLGGYSGSADGLAEFGTPVLGRVPYVGRGFHNAGYGRSAVSGTVTGSVRVIDLREEEFRQTGVYSR